MRITVDASALREVTSRLNGAPGRVGAAASALLRTTAFAIEGTAQFLAPVDTGALRSSISTTISGDGRFGTMAAEIGPTVEYGIYQEYGTSRMAGKPFLGPAFDQHAPAYASTLGQVAADGTL